MSGTRISSLLGKITVLVIICCCCLPAQAKYGGGSGEPNDPYLIYDANQMNAIGADSNDWDKHFKLMVDIDLGGYTGTQFNIIDNFKGVFDGNGHTISNFTYNSTEVWYVGLFCRVDSTGAEIKDLGLIDPNVDAGTGSKVGSLVGGLSKGIIINCFMREGRVSGGHDVGGLVGFNNGRCSIINSYSSGDVSGGNRVGGLVGHALGVITNCYSSGSVSGRGEEIGGLVGENMSRMSNCYSVASVSGSTDVGGLVGWNRGGDISYCYSTGSVSGNSDVGGLVGSGVWPFSFCSYWDIETSGQDSSAGGRGRTTAQMKTASTFAGWGCPGVWTLDEGNDYPRLFWENMPGEPITTPAFESMAGTGTQTDPYLIYTARQFNMIGNFPCEWDKHFKLMADIDLSTGGNIIGMLDLHDKGFEGTFDGNNHKIANFTYVNDYHGIGLFTFVGINGTIKNLGLIDPYVVGEGLSGGLFVGSLVGYNTGNISGCYSQGGYVEGKIYVGGLVGFSSGQLSGCMSSTNVGGAWGCVSRPSHLGGLTGTNEGLIFNCYATGNISDRGVSVGGLVGSNLGSIFHCYSIGLIVDGFSDIGGLVGNGDPNDVNDSFWDIQTSEQLTSAGGTGLMTDDMQAMSTFTDAGWDFVGERINGSEDIWMMTCEGMSYPKLNWWQPVLGDYFCPDGVDMIDMEHLALHWLDTGCDETNDYCDWAEISNDSTIDFTDLAILADNWLAGR